MIFYLGDVSEDFSTRVKLVHPDANFFLDEKNTSVLYGSLGDTNLNNLLQYLMSAEKIVFDSCIQNTELKNHSYILLHRLITVMNKEVDGFDFDFFYSRLADLPFCLDEINTNRHWGSLFNYTRSNFTGLLDYRKNRNNQLWIAGCSYANGAGLPDKSYAYASIVAKNLNLPLSWLSKGGASISFSADQILRSNLKSGDILLWGISGIHRLSVLDQANHEYSATLNFVDQANWNLEYKTFVLDSMTHNNQISSALKSISQVIHKCLHDQVDLKLIPHPELSFPEQYNGIKDTVETHPGYIDLYKDKYHTAVHLDVKYAKKMYSELYTDLGNDNDHPGILTHKEWAKIILDCIK